MTTQELYDALGPLLERLPELKDREIMAWDEAADQFIAVEFRLTNIDTTSGSWWHSDATVPPEQDWSTAFPDARLYGVMQ